MADAAVASDTSRLPPAPHGAGTVDVLGVHVHDVTLEETLQILARMVQSGRPHHIVTVNPEFVMLAQRDPEFLKTIRNADLVLPDGIGILLAARALGMSIRQRVTGVDTVRAFASIASERGYSMFLLGAAPGVAERTAEILRRDNPGLRIAGTHAGSPRREEEDAICAMIERAKPDALFVAYGPPRQDLWIARTMSRIQVPIAMGVGGTFDFIAGVSRRAPIWVQRAGLEWLHRLIKEPWRWKRMMTLPQFAGRVASRRILSTMPTREL